MSNKTPKLYGFYSGYVDAGDKPQRLADDLECDAVIMSVWTTYDNGTDAPKNDAGGNPIPNGPAFVSAEIETYWGFGGNCVHQLFPGDNTDYIWVKNARDIYVRRNVNGSQDVRVSYSLFKFADREKLG
jgi:hypothetical protein